MLILSSQDKLDNAQARVEKARLLVTRTYFFRPRGGSKVKGAALETKCGKVSSIPCVASGFGLNWRGFEREGVVGEVKCTKLLLRRIDARVTG